MTRVLFVSRSTLFTQAGGDTLQMEQTAKYLQKSGYRVTFYNGSPLEEEDYDILHFFNITRPADLLPFLNWKLPKVLSAIYIDYSEYDRLYRKGLAGRTARIAGSSGAEYLKTLARGVLGKDRMPPLSYITLGQKQSIQRVLEKCDLVITASQHEYEALASGFSFKCGHEIIPLGSEHLSAPAPYSGERSGVVCAARIEGLKNQLSLIRALNDSGIHLKIIGKPAANQMAYLEECQKEARSNVEFTGFMNQNDLALEFSKAKVHVLPSYYETTGLSTLEALKMGCQVVITARGGQKEIFGEHAFYCDPNDPGSIWEAINKALESKFDHSKWVWENFSSVAAAGKISDIYRSLLQQS
ncbi:MAG TPA: hypothetical protein DCG19_11555 [Cryomorphaceae bacterium]|nr:hypothetical protein [Cryomorphaceae bacterium]